MAVTGNVISASRRTDIPAFYSTWLVNRLKAGTAMVRHPYTKKWYAVSLKAEDVSALVLWSKNYFPLLEKLEAIQKSTHRLFFHFTITGNHAMEPHVPDYRDAARDFVYLAGKYSPEHLVWRFDPLCMTGPEDFALHEERFIRIAELLEGHVHRCFISFTHPYGKVLANFRAQGQGRLLDLTNEEKKHYSRHLSGIARTYGIELFACCNDYLLGDGVGKASCIDGPFLSGLFHSPLDCKAAPSRKECACTKSIDIGAYDTCTHGCLYCYANSGKAKALKAFKEHDPRSSSLTADAPPCQRDGQEQEDGLYR